MLIREEKQFYLLGRLWGNLSNMAVIQMSLKLCGQMEQQRITTASYKVIARVTDSIYMLNAHPLITPNRMDPYFSLDLI